MTGGSAAPPTADQIARVRRSFVTIAPQTDAVAARFYGRLFNLAPETRAMFRADMTDQGRKLFLTLAAVVEALDRPDALLPMARALAQRHIRYGVTPQHYQIVGAALLDTLRGALGPAFDAETEEAWEAAYALLAEVMIAES